MSLKLYEKHEEMAVDIPLGKFEIIFEDDQTRVTKWEIAPGEGTGWHRHSLPYVVVQHSGGALTLYTEDGTERVMRYKPGGVLRGAPPPFEHHAVNHSDTVVKIMEIEFKHPVDNG